MAKRKGAPKFGADPLEKVTKARLASAKPRTPAKKGTFHHGPKSASSSHRGMGGGGGQRRDRKGRFT